MCVRAGKGVHESKSQERCCWQVTDLLEALAEMGQQHLIMLMGPALDVK